MGKFKEFLKESEEVGTYVGGRIDSEVSADLVNLSKEYLEGSINEEIHTTILYSTKPCPEYKELGEVSYNAVYDALHIFQGETNVLVVKLSSQDLINRHETLMEEHQASYDFPEYIPHITLSYDVGDLKVEDIDSEFIDKLKEMDFTITYEYYEPLNTNWKAKEA